LSNRLFRTTLSVAFFASAGFIGTLFLVPLFLQEVRGASPLDAGLTTFPEAIGVVVSTQIVARLYPRIGPRRLMAGGLVGMATAITLLALVGLSSGPWVFRALMFMVGFGMAYVFLPNQAASLATISRAETGRATTFTNIQRQVGAAIGVAALSSVLAVASARGGVGDLTAYRTAFLVAAGFALIGSLLALRVPDAEAAETMQMRAKRSPSGEVRVAETG
ncbi:MAG: MFS transporter, partial [Thermomicrobiales bacterium]